MQIRLRDISGLDLLAHYYLHVLLVNGHHTPFARSRFCTSSATNYSVNLLKPLHGSREKEK